MTVFLFAPMVGLVADSMALKVRTFEKRGNISRTQMWSPTGNAALIRLADGEKVYAMPSNVRLMTGDSSALEKALFEGVEKALGQNGVTNAKRRASLKRAGMDDMSAKLAHGIENAAFHHGFTIWNTSDKGDFTDMPDRLPKLADWIKKTTGASVRYIATVQVDEIRPSAADRLAPGEKKIMIIGGLYDVERKEIAYACRRSDVLPKAAEAGVAKMGPIGEKTVNMMLKL